jgi:hypothetical protein
MRKSSNSTGFTSNNIWQHGLDCSFSFPWIQKKKKYLQIIGINRKIFNVATFNVTMMSISSTKKKIDFFLNRVGATGNIFLVIPILVE